MNPLTLIFSAAAAMADFGKSLFTSEGSRGPRHHGNQYQLSNDLYGRARDGSIRLRKPKSPSRADTRRAIGVVNRPLNLFRLGRITRAAMEARADSQLHVIARLSRALKPGPTILYNELTA